MVGLPRSAAMPAAEPPSPAAAPPLLSVRRLSKDHGKLRVLSPLTFEVREGELLGVIGPNGAGKTTLFALLSGHLAPSEGEVHGLFETGHQLFFGLLLAAVIVWAPSGLLGGSIRRPLRGGRPERANTPPLPGQA